MYVGKESWIISSTGNYIVTWNFNKVKRGHRFAYKIKKCAHKVVADDFMLGQADSVVVVEKNNVFVENRQ